MEGSASCPETCLHQVLSEPWSPLHSLSKAAQGLGSHCVSSGILPHSPHTFPGPVQNDLKGHSPAKLHAGLLLPSGSGSKSPSLSLPPLAEIVSLCPYTPYFPGPSPTCFPMLCSLTSALWQASLHPCWLLFESPMLPDPRAGLSFTNLFISASFPLSNSAASIRQALLAQQSWRPILALFTPA